MIDINHLKNIYEKNKDVKFRELKFSRTLHLIYDEGLINTEDIENFISEKLEIAVRQHQDLTNGTFLDIQEINCQIDEIDQNLFSGKLLIIDKSKMYSLNMIKTPSRSPEESNIDITISGPRDSFVENLQTNTALIRKRLKTNSLKYETFVVGKRSKTTVGLFYIDDIIDSHLVDDIKSRIQKIDVDAVVTMSEFRSYLYKDKASAMPLATYTQRPDYCVTSLLAGKFVILLDNFNTATIGPTTLPFFTDFSDDVNDHYFATIMNRIIYFFSLGISLYLMGFILALYTYNPELLPITILSNMISMRKGIVLPVHLEILFATFLFELFRIAGTRLPAGISSTLLVIGGVLLGQITIASGLISYDIMFLTSLSIICNYSISNNLSLNNVVTTFKWVVFIFCLFLGSYGFILSFILITAYFASKDSFGIPITTPLAPMKLSSLPKMFVGRNFVKKKKRPYYNHPQDKENA